MTTTDDLIYSIEPSRIAVLTFETPSSRGTGRLKWATVKAVIEFGDAEDDRVDASYLSHEGEATESDIAYALRCIETNSFAS